MAHPTANLSIICANYNNGAYIEACIRSVAEGTWLPLEMIVVDDGSTDHSREVIESLAVQYSWLKPHFLPENVGVANASNHGIRQAIGEYILRLDADDMVLPHRIEKQYLYMQNHPEIDVLGGNCVYIDAQTEKTIRPSRFPEKHQTIHKLYIMGENGVLNGTTVVKRAWFQQFQYRQEMVWAEDYDFFARLLHAGAQFATQPEPLTLVRIHRHSATSNIKIDTLLKAWYLSKELFNNPKPLWFIRANYYYLFWFRKSMLTKHTAPRWLYLAIAVLFRPDKLRKYLPL
jgi:glycosyltransferase involved in cell wall biosynthesis